MPGSSMGRMSPRLDYPRGLRRDVQKSGKNKKNTGTNARKIADRMMLAAMLTSSHTTGQNHRGRAALVSTPYGSMV